MAAMVYPVCAIDGKGVGGKGKANTWSTHRQRALLGLHKVAYVGIGHHYCIN